MLHYRKTFIVAFILVTAFSTVAALAQSKKLAAEMIQQHLLETKEMQETREILSPDIFASKPYIARTYEIANEIPQVLDKLFCYCYCSMNPKFKHKSLLTCYTDNHASMCGTCMSEAVVAMKMTQANKTPSEIAEVFKKKYLNGHSGHN